MNLEGNKVATTEEIVYLAALAAEEDFERQLDAETLAKLDPAGKHIVCLRPEKLAGFKSEDYQFGVSKLNLTLGTPLPCEIMLKPKHTMKMVKAWLDIPLYGYQELEDVPEYMRASRRIIPDGQRRKKW